MQVRTKLTFLSLSSHCTNYLPVNNKCANVSAFSFLNKFLYDDTCVQSVESFDHRFRSLFIFGEHHSQALRAFKKLNHHWSSSYCLDYSFGFARVVHKNCLW